MFGGNKTTGTPAVEAPKQRSNGATPKIGTLIGAGTTIEGNIKFSGGLHIDGTVQGNVIAGDASDATVTLSAKGRVIGEVRVPQVKMDGTVEGDVYSTKLVELSENARVTGNVHYSLIKMGMGSQVNGQLVHTKPEGEVVSMKDTSKTAAIKK